MSALAQPGDSRPSSATTTLGENKVTITVSGGERLIAANGLPDTRPDSFPDGAIRTASRRKLQLPRADRSESCRQTHAGQRRVVWRGAQRRAVRAGHSGVWNNQREWNYEAKSASIDLGLDQNNAHVQPTGAYHYHGLPTGLMQKLGGNGKKMLLVGYAADGFPVYTNHGHSVATNAASPLKKMRSSWQLEQGERAGGPEGKYDGKFTADYEFVKGSGDLDECNGRFGVTPEYPRGIYHYFITDEFPQLARFWRGTPDSSFRKRGLGRGGFGPGGRGPHGPGGPPPPGVRPE